MLFAAVGSDGTNEIVWGIGDTETRAVGDAEYQLMQAEKDLAFMEKWEIYPITIEQAKAVSLGQTAWPLRGGGVT